MNKEAMKLEKIMEQAQVFASAWSLVGGRFDNGNMLDEAEAAKKELRQMVAEAMAEQPASVQQEPVAWLRKSDLVELRACNYMRLGADSPSIWAPNAPDEPSPDMELVAVYTPPQPARRTWVGLTNKERENVIYNSMTPACVLLATEAKLKEKNT